MRKFRFLLGMGVVAGALFSCAPETIPADSDGIADGKYTINYGVQVVPIGDVSRGQVDASVTIQTQNGVTTKTVGADGIAVFEGLNAGTISGYVSANGFASVNFKAYCAPNNVDVNSNGYVSSTVYIPAKNSTVSGRFYGDWDQDGTTTLLDAGNFQILNFKMKYNVTGSYPMGSGDGGLTQVSLDYGTYAKATDASGNLVMDQLPNTDLGYFSAYLKMDAVSLPSVSNPPYQVVWNYNFGFVGLNPGETIELGDNYIP